MMRVDEERNCFVPFVNVNLLILEIWLFELNMNVEK